MAESYGAVGNSISVEKLTALDNEFTILYWRADQLASYKTEWLTELVPFAEAE